MRWFWLPVICAMLLVTSSSWRVVAQDKKKDEKKVEPRVLVSLPLGVQPGKATKLTLRGVALDTATDVKILDGKGSAKLLNKGKAGVPDKNPDKVGDTQVEVEIKLNEPLPTGTVSVVVTTPGGETKPHALLVETTLVLLAEKEPNDGFRTAQTVKLPVVIEGTIGRAKDVDVFQFEGKAGQKVVIEIVAARHGSPLDAMLTLYDGNLQQIAFNDDFDKSGDARIETTLPADGVYFVSLIDAHDTGSNIHVYRLMVR
jgi:hypothetical protein